MPDCIVKQCTQLLNKPLTNTDNASPEPEIFPDQLKIAKVIPLHKRGDKNDIQNYRRTALLPAFSLPLEKLMYSRLMAFIVGIEVLSNVQHGFRTNKSTESTFQFFVESTL